MEKITTIKNWIIRKLGGIVPSDLPTTINMQIFNYWAKKTMEANSSKIIKMGFSQHYVPPEK